MKSSGVQFAVEWLQMKVSKDMKYFEQKDHQVWTIDHEGLSFFRGKQSWLSPQDPHLFTCVLYWQSRQLWYSIPESDDIKNEKKFDELVGHIVNDFIDLTKERIIVKIDESTSEKKNLKYVQMYEFITEQEVSIEQLRAFTKVRHYQIWKQALPHKIYYFFNFYYSEHTQFDQIDIVMKNIGFVLVQSRNYIKVRQHKKRRLIDQKQ